MRINMKNALFVIILVLFGGNVLSSRSIEGRKTINGDFNLEQVFCMSQEGLFELKTAIEAKDPLFQTSYKKLCLQAEKALVAGPFSVMQKNKIPPSGDKHDYMSVPPYAGRAALLLRIWFIDPETKMNPELEFAQRSTRVGVIDTRFLSRIIDCIGIMQNSETWTENDQAGMVEWCRQYLINVQNRIDKDHKDSGHNIASWYHVQMVSLALFTENIELAHKLLERTKARLDTALNSTGGFKRELTRTRSLSYSCFHLYAMFNLASMGEQLGMDLWNYRTNDGRGLEMALEYIAKYAGADNKTQWPYKEIEGTKGDWWEPYNDMLPIVLFHAASVYKNKNYEITIEKILPGKIDESRIQIMCGIPIRWFDTIDPGSN